MNKTWIDLSALVIEDEQIQAQMIATTLESAGFRTVVAHTGAVGIDNYRASAFDLVLVDLNLPDVSGVDVIQIIAAHTGNHATIVALTGSSDQAMLESALSAGAHDVYQKQIGAHVLRAKFSRLALEMVEERRGKQQVEDIEQRLNDTISTLETCAADRGREIDDLRTMFRQYIEQPPTPPLLTPEQISEIASQAAKAAVAEAAENAAEIAMELIERNMQLKVGKFVLGRFYIVIGALVIGAASWMAGKGLIQV